MSSAQAFRKTLLRHRERQLLTQYTLRSLRSFSALGRTQSSSNVGQRSLHAEATAASASSLDPRLAAGGAAALLLASGGAYMGGSSVGPNDDISVENQPLKSSNDDDNNKKGHDQPLVDSSIAAVTNSSSHPSTTSCEPRRSRGQPRNAMVNTRKSRAGRGLYDKYNVDWATVLGEGAYGSVHPARLATTGEKVALKKISKRYTSSSSFQTETDALFRIYDNGGHPNISGLRDMYDDHNFYYLILDLVSGGEMLEHLINNGAYSEADAARLMHEIASAMAFLHGVGVVHADLKPENLLLSTKNRLDGSIKIIDFGCAVLEDMEDMNSDPSQDFVGTNKSASSTGTTAYWPPERFKEGSFATPGMDMWSVGVILYIMLTGCHPFDVNGVSTDEETEDQIREGKGPPMDPQIVGHLSDSALDLIQKLMDVDPTKRMTAYEMLQHPWVRGETATKEKIEDSDKKLSRFRDVQNKLEAAMFSVLINQGHSDARMSEGRVHRKSSLKDATSVNILKKAFDVFDAEGKGFINADDLGRVAREKTGVDVSSREATEFLASQDDADGDISGSSHISMSRFKKLFSNLRHRHYPRGHHIFRAGEPGDAMYFLSSGKVEIQTRKGQLVALLRAGDFFGEGSLLEEGTKRFTSAKCSTPVDVIEISRDEFERYIGNSIEARRDVGVKWRARSLQYAKNLLRLQKNVEIKTYKKGEAVYKEGETGQSMFRVDENGGELEVSHKNVSVHKYLPGDSFGESSLLFDRPRSSTVTCASKVCRLHEMKGSDFLAVLESSPEMAQSLRDMCRKRLLKKAVKQYSLSLKRGLTNEDIVAAFHDADIDHNGSLSLEELRRLIHSMDPNFPMDEIRALLKFVDVDNDGQITLKEFKRLFRQFDEADDSPPAK